jgi:hypothetical protein
VARKGRQEPPSSSPLWPKLEPIAARAPRSRVGDEARVAPPPPGACTSSRAWPSQGSVSSPSLVAPHIGRGRTGAPHPCSSTTARRTRRAAAVRAPIAVREERRNAELLCSRPCSRRRRHRYELRWRRRRPWAHASSHHRGYCTAGDDEARGASRRGPCSSAPTNSPRLLHRHGGAQRGRRRGRRAIRGPSSPCSPTPGSSRIATA